MGNIKVTRTKNKKIHDDLKKMMESRSLSVGWISEKKYENGAYVAQVAARNEYGDSVNNVPPRPFMGPAVSKNKGKWQDIVSYSIKKNGIEKSLKILGEVVVGDIKEAIRDVQSPALKASTVAARLARYSSAPGKDYNASTAAKPLIDTKIMINSVEYKVE